MPYPAAAARGHMYQQRNGLLKSLIGFWPSTEAAGANNLLDLHTNALTFTQVGSPGSAAGKVYSAARSFSGSGQYATRADGTQVSTGDVDFTWAMWVYLSTVTATLMFVDKGAAGASQKEYNISWNYTDFTPNSRFQFTVSSNGTANTNLFATTFGAASASTWYFLLCQHDSVANTIGISVNNGTLDTSAYSSGVRDGTSAVWFGRLVDVDYGAFNGRMGPIMMWKSAAGGGGILSANQKAMLYNSGAGLPYASFTA